MNRSGLEARQSHDGYQLLLGDKIFLFYGWNRGSHPPNIDPLSRSVGYCRQYSKSGDRTDMQLDEGFWMRWSDDWGSTFNGGRVVVPVRRSQ